MCEDDAQHDIAPENNFDNDCFKNELEQLSHWETFDIFIASFNIRHVLSLIGLSLTASESASSPHYPTSVETYGTFKPSKTIDKSLKNPSA